MIFTSVKYIIAHTRQTPPSCAQTNRHFCAPVFGGAPLIASDRPESGPRQIRIALRSNFCPTIQRRKPRGKNSARRSQLEEAPAIKPRKQGPSQGRGFSPGTHACIGFQSGRTTSTLESNPQPSTQPVDNCPKRIAGPTKSNAYPSRSPVCPSAKIHTFPGAFPKGMPWASPQAGESERPQRVPYPAPCALYPALTSGAAMRPKRKPPGCRPSARKWRPSRSGSGVESY